VTRLRLRWCATAAWAAACLLSASAATAQSVLERAPNMHGGWTGVRGSLHLHVVHRFNNSGAPERQVQNRPTFLLAYSGPWRVLGGAHYATRSALVSGVPNEWELFLRRGMLQQDAGAPVDVAVHAAYNAAARSLDGELSAARRAGPLRVLAAARVLGNDAGTGSGSAVVTAGAALRLHEHIALAADAGTRRGSGTARRSARGIVWGAGIQLRLPATPHTLSLHAANTDATTLHSASRVAGQVRWGFEFTTPITPARYRRTAGSPDNTVASAASADVAVGHLGDTVVVNARLHNLRFEPDTIRVAVGTVVEWHNADPLEHTVTAEDRSWDSGPIAPGTAWRRRFNAPGRFDIVCTPHPFMRAVLIVE
jgi:plastocyanin